MALSADGDSLASGGRDETVRLWEASTRRPLATLRGHDDVVWGVPLSAAGQLVASSSFDGTVRLLAVSSGACLRVLRPDRRCERLDITGLSGITEAQRAALLALATSSETRRCTQLAIATPRPRPSSRIERSRVATRVATHGLATSRNQSRGVIPQNQSSTLTIVSAG